MFARNKKPILFMLIALLVGYIIYDSTSQPGTNDLKGNFRELAVYRNENNTGPIVRVYAVSVEGLVWDEMRKYGDLMPYNKYGSTKVYFFEAGKPAPDRLAPTSPYFNPSLEANCLGVYSKDQNGTVSFEQRK